MWKNCAFRIAHKFCSRWDRKRKGKRHFSKTLLPCIFGFFFSILSRFSLLFLKILIICLKGSVNTEHPILTVLDMKSIKYHSTMRRFLTLVFWFVISLVLQQSKTSYINANASSLSAEEFQSIKNNPASLNKKKCPTCSQCSFDMKSFGTSGYWSIYPIFRLN